MKVMITGAAGFIGRSLVKHCSEADCSVLGLDISEPGNIGSGVAFEHCDVRDSERLPRLVSTFRPDRIFHLAAQSYPTVSLAKPLETMDINAGGTINLFECLRTAGIVPLVVVACSSAEYGPVASVDLPVKEDHPLRPLHAYGVSKVAEDLLAAQYFSNYSIPCVRIRIFNTTGPGKIGDVCSDLTKRAIEIELGLRGRYLPVGNLTSRRAILDVRDLIRALWLSAERCELGDVYNVCGGQSYSVQELIETIRSQAGTEFEIEQESSLRRACDEPVIAGDSSKFQHRTGWTQTMDLTETLGEMLQWWRTQLVPELTSHGHLV
jgi:GDP-4-dehydro-6-deoxy-D-mannose reductase